MNFKQEIFDDKVLLSSFAEQLEILLLQYGMADPEVSKLHSSLLVLIGQARTCVIAEPIEWRDIPGVYYFSEGGLGKYGDVETAYAKFKIQISGGESPALRNLLLSASTDQ